MEEATLKLLISRTQETKDDLDFMQALMQSQNEVMRKEVTGYKQSPFGSHEFVGVDLK